MKWPCKYLTQDEYTRIEELRNAPLLLDEGISFVLNDAENKPHEIIREVICNGIWTYQDADYTIETVKDAFRQAIQEYPGKDCGVELGEFLKGRYWFKNLPAGDAYKEYLIKQMLATIDYSYKKFLDYMVLADLSGHMKY